MRVLSSMIVILIILQSCDGGKDKKTREILKIAIDYASGQVEKPEMKTGQNGIIVIGNDEKNYLIDPSALFTGFVDEDEKEDAIISVTTYRNGFQGPTEHLFIINIDNRLVMQKSFESDMRILGLKDRIITAEVPEHPRTSPLFNCPECRDLVHYRYRMGELTRVD